jgi:penicillin-insensitive murein endopeptidase
MLRTAKPVLFALTACLWLTACENPSDRSPPGTGPAPSVANDTSAAAQFAAVRGPTRDAARVYGTYTRGCIAGAHQLAADSPRWQILNPQRNRAWGHPALLRFIDRLAASVATDGHRGLLVGDLAQPRGRPAAVGPQLSPGRPRCRHLADTPSCATPVGSRARSLRASLHG